MKKHLSTAILILIFVTGLSLLLYPTVANWWNQRHASSAVAAYTSVVANTSRNELADTIARAEEYNRKISKAGNRFSQRTDEEMAEYNSQLAAGGSAMMGYLTIPKIDVSLPIYHGTEETVLAVGIGHLEGTSLPIGGESSHCVLSGHRGLPSARLLTDLDKLNTGDEFYMEVYGMTLTYQVDQILVVVPEDVMQLQIREGMDYCTIFTCTPYGINTHRLLVRGHRVENALTSNARITADAIQIEPITVAPIVAAPILLLLLVWLLLSTPKKKPRGEK